MKKESKISIAHFEKQNLAKVLFAGKLIHPMYFRIVHKRKQLILRSKSFDELLTVGLNYSDNLLHQIIYLDDEIIKKIISKVEVDNKIFSFEKFKEYYKKYSVNVLKFLNNKFIDDIIPILKDENFPLLSNLIEKHRGDISIKYAMKLLCELDKEKELYNRVDKGLNYQYSFITDFIGYMYVDPHKTDEIGNQTKFSDSYVPFIDWISNPIEMEFALMDSAHKIAFLNKVDKNGDFIYNQNKLTHYIRLFDEFYNKVTREIETMQ